MSYKAWTTQLKETIGGENAWLLHVWIVIKLLASLFMAKSLSNLTNRMSIVLSA